MFLLLHRNGATEYTELKSSKKQGPLGILILSYLFPSIYFVFSFHFGKFIIYIWNKEELNLMSGRSLLLYQFTRRAIKLTVVIIFGYHCYQLRTKFYPISFSQG
jgi:hypothetical protein